jgi:hypothetical protein
LEVTNSMLPDCLVPFLFNLCQIIILVLTKNNKFNNLELLIFCNCFRSGRLWTSPLCFVPAVMTNHSDGDKCKYTESSLLVVYF